jgi:hypothetical protein
VRVFLISILLTSAAFAAEEIDEATKSRALRLGYILNGDSMVRHPSLGSIDVRELLDLTKPRVPLVAKGEKK